MIVITAANEVDEDKKVENVVFLNLLRKYPQQRIFYGKDDKGKGIDFIVDLKNKKGFMGGLPAEKTSLKKKFDFRSFLRELGRNNITIIPLDNKVLSECCKLPENLQLHGRVITATALITNSTLITKDPEIRKIKEAKTIW